MKKGELFAAVGISAALFVTACRPSNPILVETPTIPPAPFNTEPIKTPTLTADIKIHEGMRRKEVEEAVRDYLDSLLVEYDGKPTLFLDILREQGLDYKVDGFDNPQSGKVLTRDGINSRIIPSILPKARTISLSEPPLREGQTFLWPAELTTIRKDGTIAERWAIRSDRKGKPVFNALEVRDEKGRSTLFVGHP